MHKQLEDLFWYAMECNERRAAESFREARKAEPLHGRLLELVGEEEGEEIWNAAVLAGSSEAMPAFKSGACFGLRLLALCLGEYEKL